MGQGRSPSLITNLLDSSQSRYDRHSARTISKNVHGVISDRQYHERQVPRKLLPSGGTSFTNSTLTLSTKYTIVFSSVTMSPSWVVSSPETKPGSLGRTSARSAKRFAVQRPWESYPCSAKGKVEVLEPRRTESWPAQRMSRIYRRRQTK